MDQENLSEAKLNEEKPSESGDERPALPAADFDFLIYSLRLQAEMSMGLLPIPDAPEPDFDLARHNIDLLAMLQEKTKGNLTTEEQRALENSLTELRFRFLEAQKKSPA